MWSAHTYVLSEAHAYAGSGKTAYTTKIEWVLVHVWDNVRVKHCLCILRSSVQQWFCLRKTKTDTLIV